MLGYAGEWKYGDARYTQCITEALNKLGVHTEIFTVGVAIRTIGPPLFLVRNSLRDFHSFDIVHSNEAAGMFVRHRRKVELCHHPHWRYPSWSNYVVTALQLFAARRANAIVVPSYYTARELRRRIPDSAAITVIPHGVDRKIFHPSLAERERTREALGIQDAFVAISVGRLEPHKRHVDIIDALSKVPNARLIIVGRGALRTYLIREARRRDLRTLLFSEVSDNYLRALYNSADVYVHSSRLEGFGLTVIEAMSCGLPVVAVRTADLEHVVGPAGYVVDSQPANALLKPLMTLASDGSERRRLGRLALRRSAGFDWATAARKHLCVYEEVLQQ